MGEAIGQLLPFAVGVAISPMPIVAVVLMLVTPRAAATARRSWSAGSPGSPWPARSCWPSPARRTPASRVSRRPGWTGSSWSWGCCWCWSRCASGGPGPMPARRPRPPSGWAPSTTSPRPRRPGAGVLLGTVNPKNLLFIIGGAAAVAQTGIGGGEQAAAWAVFCVLASLGVAAPLVIYFAMGTRAADLLDGLKTWMATHNTAVMAVLCLIVGVKLLGDAISGFSG